MWNNGTMVENSGDLVDYVDGLINEVGTPNVIAAIVEVLHMRRKHFVRPAMFIMKLKELYAECELAAWEGSGAVEFVGGDNGTV